MKQYVGVSIGCVLAICVGICVWIYQTQSKDIFMTIDPSASVETKELTTVTPISHATMVLTWGNEVLYTDPVGEASVFQGQPKPTLILVTDIHGDHLNADTLSAVAGDATVIVPQAVKDVLPNELAGRVVVMNNGEVRMFNDMRIEAIPMYNLPESEKSFHTKGRGNGYVIERNGYRVYVAGDTAGIPEMRTLKDIDMAFVPMNLPYTMSVEDAADAVLAFKPKQVYPYHYRGPGGLSDVQKFKELVQTGNSAIDVVLLNWYPSS